MPEQTIPDGLVERYFNTILQFQRMFLDEHKRSPEYNLKSGETSEYRKLLCGLKHSEQILLYAIQYVVAQNNSEGVSMSDLSRLLHVKPPSITAPLNHMEKKGLVCRVQDSNDRRIVRVYITERGERCLEQAKQAFYARTRELLAHLGTEKAEQYIELTEEVLAYVRSKHDQHCNYS